ncbi:MAG: hypothetical protein ACRDGM_13075 [bacterium]
MESAIKLVRTLGWAPAQLLQRLFRRPSALTARHLILTIGDHFEPAILPGVWGGRASRGEQQRRLDRWCREFPKIAAPWRDSDGYPLRHTYFYPAEQYDEELVEQLADHCHAGWGEVEVHLHHGVERPDTAENTRRILVEFRDRLAGHGCLSRWEGQHGLRYAFVHGNWALANSAGGRNCGVDEELAVLADTGCYADFTLPAAPDPAQTAKINALYECGDPLARRAAHRRGRDLTRGRRPAVFPLIVQGPLAIEFGRGWFGWRPRIENGDITGSNPATIERLQVWRRAAIGVRGVPDWVFVKLHCHGMDPRDDDGMLGDLMTSFLHDFTQQAPREWGMKVHFATAREMVNIILAACDGREGEPGDYRDYRLRLVGPCRLEW